MAFRTTDRYGGVDRYDDDADVPAIVESLLQELETEQFEEPDNEHAEISVSYDDWALSVHVSGRLTLDDLSWITGSDDDIAIPPLCQRAASRQTVAAMLTMMAQGQLEELRAIPGWVPPEQLPPYQGDFFRQHQE